MQITVRKGNLTVEPCDLLVINWFANVKTPGGASAAVNAALSGLVEKTVTEEHFKAEPGTTLLLRTTGLIPAKRVLVVGLGEKKDFDEEVVRVAAAASLNVARGLRAKKVVSVLHGAGHGGLSPRVCGKAMAEGVRLAAYFFGRYKDDTGGKPPVTFEIVTIDPKAVKPASEGVRFGDLFARATTFARDLVNTPRQHMAPSDLVSAARGVAKGKGSITVKVFDKEQLKRMGAGGLLGIAQGSDHPPFMVHLVYKPKVKSKKKIAFVGKGVTFDSGGLSLKPAEHMTTMKLDMSGAADVLGVFSVIAELAPKVEVHGIFGACENMPSGKAICPGDVVEVMNGKTIEILNTDAEGRVTLADTLTYATRQKPDLIIDLATLTGACMVALGEEVTGLMSNNDALAQKVLTAASAAGEKMWQLPLEKNYKKEIKSEIADYKNTTSRYGGAIGAGLLLEEFVAGLPWVHLDIAGPAYCEKPLNAYTKKGGTGHGVRTLLEFLRAI